MFFIQLIEEAYIEKKTHEAKARMKLKLALEK